MSGFELDIDYLSFKLTDLEGLTRQILSPDVLTKAMGSALDEVENQLKQGFQERQGQWKPLAKSTQLQRLGQGYGPQSPILIRSETLMNNAASGREIQITGGELRGDVFPNDDASPEYSNSSIGDYMETLDRVRPFYDLTEAQMSKVYEAFENSLIDSLGLT
jgi:hypothetical protein